MKIHEYQAKQILKEYNIKIPKGAIVDNVNIGNLEEIINKLEFSNIIIKAQIHSGGRGLAGGIKTAKSKLEAIKITKDMIGQNLITKQNGPTGEIVKNIYLEEEIIPIQEIYLSFILDRVNNCISILYSKTGGMHIEDSNNTQLMRINSIIGICDFHVNIILNELGLDYIFFSQLKNILINLYNLMLKEDASLIEINPLIITNENELIALDAKMQFDENALYRNKRLQEISAAQELDATLKKAKDANLNFIPLNGEIACIVNGAGLAMATNDLIKLYGEKHNKEAANFLDLGGGATENNIKVAFEIISSYSNITKILINIFGGIVKCDLIANGLLNAIEHLNIKIPIVARLEGTNSQIAKEILQNAKIQNNIKIEFANSLEEAAKLAIE
ncbi:MAG: ADP-forming succinate--CoA ligase subunit beta [Rickettsiales bacterium]